MSLGYVNCIGAAPHAETTHQEELARPDLLMWNNNTDEGTCIVYMYYIHVLYSCIIFMYYIHVLVY